MAEFIFLIILLFCVGTVLYLAARSLPRVNEEDLEPIKRGIFEKWVMSDIPHRMDTATNLYVGKFCRKLKVFLMKFDNYLTERIKKMSGNGEEKPKIDLTQLDTNLTAKESETTEVKK